MLRSSCFSSIVAMMTMAKPEDSKDEQNARFPQPVWPKHCSYCKNSISENDWEKLEYAGVQRGIASHGIPNLEMRYCYCSRMLSIVAPNDFVKIKA